MQEVAPEERLGRDKLTELMVQRARQNMPYLGIELIDVRIKSINYGTRCRARVYERMILRSAGGLRRVSARKAMAPAPRFVARKERELDRIRSEGIS